MVEHKELLRRLRSCARAITTHVPNVNRGGCAVVAGAVGDVLQDMGVMVEVVTPTEYHKPAAEVRHNVTNPRDPRDWSHNGLSRSHLAVRFRSAGKCYTWDSAGLRKGASRFGEGGRYRTTKAFGDGLSIAECRAMASTGRGWNPSFNRKHIPKIRAIVEYHLVHGL